MRAIAVIYERSLADFVRASFFATYGFFLNRFLKKPYILRAVNNYRMWLSLTDRGICRSLLLFGQRELDHKWMMERFIKKGMRVLDIGANIGYYVLMEGKLVGPDGGIIAVEPSPTNIDLLKKNLKENGSPNNVKIISGAVSNEVGKKEFFLSTQCNLNTFHTDSSAAAYLNGKSIVVDTYTVDQIVGDDQVDLIRMDVEGHEIEVLEGLLHSARLGRHRPSVIFETHFSRYIKDSKMENLLREYFKIGYRVKYLSSSKDYRTKEISSMGYSPLKILKTDGEKRGIFENIKDEDAIYLLCKHGGARTVLLEHRDRLTT